MSVNSGESDGSENESDDQDDEEESISESEEEDDPAETAKDSSAATLKATVDALFHLSERMDASRGRLRARFPVSRVEPAPPPIPSPLLPATPAVTLVDPYLHSTRAPADDLDGWASAPHVAAALRTLLGQDGAADQAILRDEHTRLAMFGTQGGNC